MKPILAAVLSFFGPVAALVTALAADSSLIFPNATVAAFAGYALTQMADQIRRLDHSGTQLSVGTVPLQTSRV